MGYTLSFEGRIAIEPPLDAADVLALRSFARTGRLDVEQPAASAVVASESFVMPARTSNHGDDEPLGPSEPIPGAPSGSCCWRPAPDGATLEWDGCERFGHYEAWARFLLEWFFAPRGRVLDGRVRWEGEDGATGTLVIDGSSGSVVDEPDLVASVDDEVRSWMVALRDQSAELRLVAARQLACAVHASSQPREEAVAALGQALHEPLLAKAALESLGELGPSARGVVGAVIAQLESTDPQVRYWATYALGRIGAAASSAIPRLERMTSDSEYGPRYGAIDALKRIAASRATQQ